MVDVSRKSWGAHHDEPAEEVAERSLRTARLRAFFRATTSWNFAAQLLICLQKIRLGDAEGNQHSQRAHSEKTERSHFVLSASDMLKII